VKFEIMEALLSVLHLMCFSMGMGHYS